MRLDTNNNRKLSETHNIGCGVWGIKQDPKKWGNSPYIPKYQVPPVRFERTTCGLEVRQDRRLPHFYGVYCVDYVEKLGGKASPQSFVSKEVKKQKFISMWCRKCYNIESISKILCRMNVNGGDFILRWYSGGIFFQNTSPVEKMKIILYGRGIQVLQRTA